MKKSVMLLLTCGLTQAIFCQKTITQQLDELMSAYCKVNKFNGSVLIAQKGKVLLKKGYGISNAETETRNKANSIFQAYSITKSFTSTVVLKLIEQKKLALTDKLSRFYPDFPKGDSITIEQLLSHTAGVYDFPRGHSMPDHTEKSFMEFIKTKSLDFSPGTGWSYSNSGYYLLGFIIQKLTGMTYEEAVKHFIFRPLQMNNSGFAFKHLVSKNKTTGYAVFSARRKKEAEVYEPPGPFAAGGIYSTVGDLYTFHKALQNFSIVSKASLKKAYQPVKNNYGLGWIISTFEGKQLVSHSGGAAGYRSNLARMPEEDICIVLLNNNENALVDMLTQNLLNVMFNKPYKIPVDTVLNTALLEKYTGAFSFQPFTMYTTLEDGSLTAQVSGQPKTVLLAEQSTVFYALEANARLEFKKDTGGNFNELVLQQGNKQLSGKRIYPVWGLTGTSTEKGWNDSIPDIQLVEDVHTRGLWKLENCTLKDGLLLFRLNNDWGYHYGDNKNDKQLEMFGADIKITAGTYDIILDLTDTTTPRYSISKK